MKLKKILLLPIFFSTLGLLHGEDSQVVNRTVAVVNNEPVFEKELDRLANPLIERYKQSAPEPEQTPERLADFKREILDRLIDDTLLLQEAKKKTFRVTKVEVEKGMDQFKKPFTVDAQGKPRSVAETEKAFEAQLTLEGMSRKEFETRLEDQILKEKLIGSEVRSKVTLPTPEDAEKYFKRVLKEVKGEAQDFASADEKKEVTQLADYFKKLSDKQCRIRHIMLKIPSQATPEMKAEIRAKLEGVEKRVKEGQDFSFLARKYSEDPISKDRGGDLGFLPISEIGFPAIEEQVSKMKEGDVSGILESELGFHIIKLVEVKAPHTLEFEEVQEDLQNFLAQKNFTDKLQAYIEGLRSKASIKINL